MLIHLFLNISFISGPVYSFPLLLKILGIFKVFIDASYVGGQPSSLCATQAYSLRLFCSRATDQLGVAGIFICLGAYFGGIAVGSGTFGKERVVFWRESSAGMSTLIYFLGIVNTLCLAKLVVDIPRIFLGGLFYTLALTLFFPYRSSFASIFVIVELLYLNAFAFGYFISTVFSSAQLNLIGTGAALFFSLVL